ncbi:tetraacyldisaccharide 4'-kinase [Zobellia laminariae]|uniref:tetraacyldisaccharide 4'-kinase n=1 Tax=Zobellia laminariae TaxID=248906 RepID=UPI0034CEDDAE
MVKLKPEPRQKVLFSYLDYDDTIKAVDDSISLEELRTKEVTLVTGIANPRPLLDYLKSKGLRFMHLKFKDHHDFSDSELSVLREKQCILTTEKDFVRLKDKVDNLYFIPVKHRFFDDGESVLKGRLQEFMK